MGVSSGRDQFWLEERGKWASFSIGDLLRRWMRKDANRPRDKVASGRKGSFPVSTHGGR